MRAIICLILCALAGCAAMPSTGCQAPQTAQSTALASQGYALVGTVSSLLIAGKLDGKTAIALNADLQKAEADLRTGKTADALALINGVKGKLP